ncbi:MAG: hypothetical protein RMX65_004090 [Nostoc sp. DedQUE01]
MTAKLVNIVLAIAVPKRLPGHFQFGVTRVMTRQLIKSSFRWYESPFSST